MNDAQSERFIQLFAAHQEQVMRYVLALLPDENDARDVLQSASIAMFRKFDTYDDSRPFVAWAYRFALIEVKRLRRSKGRSAVLLDDDVLETLAAEREQLDDALNARLKALDLCMRELTEFDRELIRDRFQRRLPADEMAQHREMSRRTLYRNLDRLRRALFDCINRKLTAEGLA